MNRFADLAVLPVESEDMRAFYFETLEVLRSEHTTDDMKQKLLRQFVEAFGSFEAFDRAFKASLTDKSQ